MSFRGSLNDDTRVLKGERQFLDGLQIAKFEYKCDNTGYRNFHRIWYGCMNDFLRSKLDFDFTILDKRRLQGVSNKSPGFLFTRFSNTDFASSHEPKIIGVLSNS